MSQATHTNITTTSGAQIQFSAAAIVAGGSTPAIADPVAPAVDDELLEATRTWLEVMMRKIPTHLCSDFQTYTRLAEHELQFAATAEADGCHSAAAAAREVAQQYRCDALAMVARHPLAIAATRFH
jgi:hypothetical protein